MKNLTFKRAGTFIFVVVFGLTSRGAWLVANAQTATGTPPVEVAQNDFERELAQFKKEIEKDLAAQRRAKEIDGEDMEQAGDNFGDNSIIDGEKSDLEIQQEINNEVDLESPESSDESYGEDNISTSTERDNLESNNATSTDGSQDWSNTSGD